MFRSYRLPLLYVAVVLFLCFSPTLYIGENEDNVVYALPSFVDQSSVIIKVRHDVTRLMEYF